MNKIPLCLDIDALRSYVVGIDSGSSAMAAKYLCRSTSAISAQLKKLELQCGTTLMSKQGRHLVPTASGEILLSYARRLLALNDEALLAVKKELVQGELTLGMQEDFGESLMPLFLGQFTRHYPGVRMTARVDRNLALMEGIAANKLDMALVWQAKKASSDAGFIGQCGLEWIHNKETDISQLLARNEPLPLVMFDAPCLMRSQAIAALDNANIPWRISFTSHSLTGIWAGVQAGLGITLRTRTGMPVILETDRRHLPSAGKMGVSLIQSGHRPSDAWLLLRELLINLVRDHVLSPG